MWKYIKEINWAERSQQHQGYYAGKRYMMEHYSEKVCAELADFVNVRWRYLNAILNIYKEEYGEIPCGGDDSYNDMLHHVIGLGEKKFYAVIKNPDILNSMTFVESFSYCLPTPEDFKNTYAEQYRQRALECMTAITQILTTNKPSYEDINTMRDIMNRLMFMVAGDFTEATRGFDDRTYNRYYKFDSNDQHAWFANTIKDCKTYMC